MRVCVKYCTNTYQYRIGHKWKSISLNNVFWCLLTTCGGLTVLLKFCGLSRLIQYLADVHPKKEEKIGVWSLVVGLGRSCLVGCFAKVEMMERVSTKSCGCNFQGGDSGPAAQRLRHVVLALACHRVGRFRHPSGIGPETLCLWPETPGRRAEAGDSDPQGPETTVCLAWLGHAPRVGRLKHQPKIGPETFVSGRRLRCWSHLGQRLRPSWPETLALVGQQRLHFVEDYIKPSSISRRGCGFHSLSSIVAELQSTRSSILATRTRSPFGIWVRRPRSTLPPRRFDFPPHFIEGLVTLVFIRTLAGRSRPPSSTLCVRACWAYWESPIELWSSPQYFV
jgi:hypothetical protein